uniref:Solute carrier family 22 member 4-like n=1 Tax=Ciona intestinalis TaxID=7719 RepID=F6TXG4_CIOIN|nr:solute carrier family 22 member 4-like isoform X2 [Ciona intestinalis]|eukprot:XP_002123929.1 solute carrier family 22 member 4-like isoform X2 [Ciona intestinalis]
MSEDKQDDDGKLNNTKQCGTLWSLLILVIPYTHISFILFSVVFLYRAPPLTCWTEQGNSSTTSEHHGATLECSSWERNGNLPAYVNSSLYVQNLNDTGNQSNNLERFCKDGWTFDTSEGNTLVSEFGLECTAAWKRPTLQSVYMIGSLFGSLFGGPITDRFGRKNTFTATFIINGCLHLPLSFTTSYVQYIVLLHFTGFLQIVLYLAGFVLAQELVPTAKRSIAALSVNVCHGLGYLILPLVAYFIRDWRWFLRFYTVACVCYFPILWFIPKSPKWVALHRSVSSKNEKMNAKEMETFIGTNNNIEQVDSDKQLSSTMDLFKQPILRRRVLIVCLLWIVTTLGFYTLGLNSSNLGGNIYLNCVYGALVDITSYVTTALILSKKGRKSATSITIGIGGIMCLITPMLRRANVNVGIASAMIGKFFITTALSIIILYTGELFPTLLRNTTYGIASATARIGRAISPFIIFAGETMNLSIPFYVTGCLSLLSAFMTIWLPETKATGLPNTLDEALELENYRTKISVRKLSASFRRKSEGTADTAG